MSRTITTALAALLAAPLLASCSTSGRADAAAAACPSAPIVAWSSEDAAPSRFVAQVQDTEAVVATAKIKGLYPGQVNGQRVGDHVFMLSVGDVRKDQAHVVDFSLTDCTATPIRLAGVVNPLSLVTDGETFSTTYVLNGVTHITRSDRQGKALAERQLPGLVVATLALQRSGDGSPARLFGITQPAPGQATSRLITLDAETLTVVSEQPLPGGEFVTGSPIVHGGRLIYPLTATHEGDRPGHELVVLDPATMSERRIDLGANTPYLLTMEGDTLYVGHTFINPAYGPIDGLRHISRVDLATSAVTGYDLDAGILGFTVRGERLALVGDDGGDPNTFVLQTYDEATGARLTSSTLPRPGGDDFYYPAGILVP